MNAMQSLLRLFRMSSTISKVALLVMLLLGNVYVAVDQPNEADAHFSGNHFHRSGVINEFGVWNFGVYSTYAQQALSNQYNNIVLLYWNYPGVHTDISVYDEDFGNTGWCGGHWPYDYDGDGHRDHSHSVYNRFCGGSDTLFVQGVYCQEIGHAWSQGHHTFGNGCMGLGYGSAGSSRFYISSHDNTDFDNFYRNH